MDFDVVMTERRSVRKYTSETVSRDVLMVLIDSACLAPTAGNMQAWRFVIVTDSEQVRKLRAVSPGMLGDPPAVVAVCEDIDAARLHGGSNGPQLAQMDAAMAAYAITLKACALQLGSCVIASFSTAAVSRLLRLPTTILPVLLVSVGHPAVRPRARVRRDHGVISWEVYGGG